MKPIKRLRFVMAAVAIFSAVSLPGRGQLVQADAAQTNPLGASQDGRPNIVVFLADDLGWQDVSLPLLDYETPLNRRYRTPNLVRMAAAGVKFTDAYSAAPICTPTRVTEMTGRSPAQTHVTNITLMRDEDRSVPFAPLLPPVWNVNGLSPTPGVPRTFSGPVLPQILHDAGYKTIHVGKGHWGAMGTPAADPHALGFDVSIGGTAAGEPASYYGQENYSSPELIRNVPDLAAYHGTDTFLTEALTIEANKEVDRAVQEGRPFFLHLAQFAPHGPIQPDPRFVGRYREQGLDSNEAAYASLVEGLDKSLGDIIANIERHGLTNNTFVAFASDNGGLSARLRGGTPHTHNAPLKSGKGSAYEGGIRVPLVIKWPARVKAGVTNHTPVISDDLFPTVLTLAQVPDRAHFVDGITGRDLAPMLMGGPSLSADRPLLWHFSHKGIASDGPGLEPFSALRVGQWKLIFFYAGRRYELYNLSSDISESHNLVESDHGTASRLSAILRGALQETGAQMPLDPSTKLPVELPPLISQSRAKD